MGMPSFPKLVPRGMARLQSAIATVMLLAVILCLSTIFIAGLSTRSKAMRRTMRPALGVAKQWAGDLSDVFVIFPWKGALLLLRLSIFVPFRALRGIGLAIRAARKTRLQRQLLEETETEGDKRKAKQAKKDKSGVGLKVEPKVK